jgi:hypothetical protein
MHTSSLQVLCAHYYDDQRKLMHALTRTYVQPEISLLVVAVPECAACRRTSNTNSSSSSSSSSTDPTSAPLRRRVLWLDTYACSKMVEGPETSDDVSSSNSSTTSTSSALGGAGAHKSPYLNVLRSTHDAHASGSMHSTSVSATKSASSFGAIAYANLVLCSEEAFVAFHAEENRDRWHTISSGEYDRNEFTGGSLCLCVLRCLSDLTTHTSNFLPTCTRLYTFVCMHIHAYIHAYMHTYTYTPIYTSPYSDCPPRRGRGASRAGLARLPHDCALGPARAGRGVPEHRRVRHFHGHHGAPENLHMYARILVFLYMYEHR